MLSIRPSVRRQVLILSSTHTGPSSAYSIRFFSSSNNNNNNNKKGDNEFDAVAFRDSLKGLNSSFDGLKNLNDTAKARSAGHSSTHNNPDRNDFDRFKRKDPFHDPNQAPSQAKFKNYNFVDPDRPEGPEGFKIAGSERKSEFSVDRSNLAVHMKPLPSDDEAVSAIGLDTLTPLEKIIHATIESTGPMSIKEFMQLCLMHPKYGFYNKERVFGKGGDFVTSPEISQMFGELLGIWCVAAYEQLGKPSRLRLVELGPGRGTLMSDMLRAFRSFPELETSLSKGGITFVEGSTELTKSQANSIKCYGRATDQHPVHKLGCGKEVEIDWQVSFQEVNKKLDEIRESTCAPRGSEPTKPSRADAAAAAASLFPDDLIADEPDTPSRAADDDSIAYPAKEGDDNEVLLVVAQEFLDALPIEQFELTEGGWCERLVDINSERGTGEGDNADVFRFVRGNNPMPLVTRQHEAPPKGTPKKEMAIGTMLETGGAAVAVVQHIARALQSNRGAALFIDYGGNPEVYGNSLRGIRDHKFVSTLSKAGETDLSVDVDFDTIKTMVKRSYEGVALGGPITQREFLLSMGIQARAQAICEKAGGDKEKIDAVFTEFKRLVEPGSFNMGEVYKVLGMVSGAGPVPALPAVTKPTNMAKNVTPTRSTSP